MSQWQSAFLAGVAASVTASVIFLILLTLLRPRIRISKFIAKRGNEDYLIKFVNRSWRACVDVQVEAYIVIDWLLPANKDGTETAPNRKMTALDLTRKSSYVRGRRFIKKLPHAPHAQRVRINSEHIAEWQASNQRKYILVRIAARDGVSGFPKVVERKYELANCVREGTFITGNSLEVTEWKETTVEPASVEPPPQQEPTTPAITAGPQAKEEPTQQ